VHTGVEEDEDTEGGGRRKNETRDEIQKDGFTVTYPLEVEPSGRSETLEKVIIDVPV
jgi:hypothetical protein